VAAAATIGSIPQQQNLHAAAELGFRIVQFESIVAAAAGEAEEHQATFTEAFADCMYHIGSAAVTAAAALAADGAWKKAAAGDALAAVTWLCSWLLSATAAGDLISLLQQRVQQHVVQLLSDGGPVASALPAAAAGDCANAAKHIADWVELALQHGGISRVPPLSLAARALRMLCDSEPLSASCLGTSFGEERLHIEVSVPPPRRAETKTAEHNSDWAGSFIIKSQPCAAVSLSCMHAACSQEELVCVTQPPCPHAAGVDAGGTAVHAARKRGCRGRPAASGATARGAVLAPLSPLLRQCLMAIRWRLYTAQPLHD
jgi:hypothetical protein